MSESRIESSPWTDSSRPGHVKHSCRRTMAPKNRRGADPGAAEGLPGLNAAPLAGGRDGAIRWHQTPAYAIDVQDFQQRPALSELPTHNFAQH